VARTGSCGTELRGQSCGTDEITPDYLDPPKPSHAIWGLFSSRNPTVLDHLAGARGGTTFDALLALIAFLVTTNFLSLVEIILCLNDDLTLTVQKKSTLSVWGTPPIYPWVRLRLPPSASPVLFTKFPVVDEFGGRSQAIA
jgi:hypothetical protein